MDFDGSWSEMRDARFGSTNFVDRDLGVTVIIKYFFATNQINMTSTCVDTDMQDIDCMLYVVCWLL